MAALNFLGLVSGLVLLIPQILCQNISTNTPTPSSIHTTLPIPTHSDVPPPTLPKSCTNNSLTSSDLRLTSFESKRSNDEFLVFLTVYNRIAGSTMNCQGVSLQWIVTGDCRLSGNVTTSTFRYDVTRRNLTVWQSWVCDDDPGRIERINFAGSGSVDVLVQCAQIDTQTSTCVSNQDTRIPFSLSKPISLTPILPPPPAGHDHPGCMASSSKGPSWVISGFQWKTGGRQVEQFIQIITVPALVLEMNITNTATNQTISCFSSCGGYIAANLTVPYNPQYVFGSPFSEDPTWCSCLTQVKGRGYNNVYYTYTNILLDPVNKVLAIDQTWYCDDEDIKKPIQFTASGKLPLTHLQCVPRPFNDDDGSIFQGQPLINGSTCSTPNDFSIGGTLSSQNKMEPYALQLPRPAPRSCTTSSVIIQHEISPNYTYNLNAFQYNTYDTLNNSNSHYEVIAQLDFILMFEGLDVQLGCHGWDPRLNRRTQNYDPNYWLSCDPYRDVDHESEGGTQHDDLQTGLVNFDAVNYVLNFNITWACSDINPNQKPAFRWITSTQLPDLSCVHDNDGGWRTHCIIPGNGRYNYWVNSSDEIKIVT